MAAEITHVVLARKFLETTSLKVDGRRFFLGVSFPDIRYLGELKRSQTHTMDFDFKKAQQKGPFFVGFLLHNLTDVVRGKFIYSQPLFLDILRRKWVSKKLLVLAFKLLEDQLLYSKVANWQQQVSFLTNVLKKEIPFAVSQRSLDLWYGNLVKFFSQSPTKESISQFSRNIFRMNPLAIKQLLTLLGKLRKMPEVCSLSEQLYFNFDHLCRQTSRDLVSGSFSP